MSRRMTTQERLIRIEIARTQAALERQNIRRSLHDLHDSLTPAGLWRSFFPRRQARRASRSALGTLTQILALTRRYPFLLTTASAVLSSVGRGRRGLIWRIGLGTLAGWKVLQKLQSQSSPRAGDDVVTHRTSSSASITTGPDRPTSHPPSA